MFFLAAPFHFYFMVLKFLQSHGLLGTVFTAGLFQKGDEAKS